VLARAVRPAYPFFGNHIDRPAIDSLQARLRPVASVVSRLGKLSYGASRRGRAIDRLGRLRVELLNCGAADHMLTRAKAVSPSFVKYTPDIEAVDPGFDEILGIVIRRTEQYIAQSVATEGTGRAVRDAHAKGYGLVRAEVEILDQLPARYAQGIYATSPRCCPHMGEPSVNDRLPDGA